MRKNSIFIIVLFYLPAIFLLNLAGVVSTAQAMTEEQFQQKRNLYFSAKISPQDFYAICEKELAEIAADKTSSEQKYNVSESAVLNAVAEVYYINGDFAAVHKIADMAKKSSAPVVVTLWLFITAWLLWVKENLLKPKRIWKELCH